MKKFLTMTALALSASLTLTGSTLSSTPPPDSGELPMEVLRYDADVAAAHGYIIRMDDEGKMSSIPVTPEAIAEEAEAAAARAQARSESNMGTCGKVWVEASKGANDMLTGKIGWETYSNVAKYNWTLVAASFLGGWAQTWNGGGTGANVGKSWSAQNTAAAKGPGWLSIRQSQVDGYVVLTNGTVCAPALGAMPSATFP